MKKQRDITTYLDDIYESIEKGISFIKDMTYDEFKEDEKTQFALVRAIEIIGEKIGRASCRERV